MPDTYKINGKIISKRKRIIVIAGLVSFFLTGFLAILFLANTIFNYVHPWIFAFCFAIPGLVAGIYLANKLRPYITVNNAMLYTYGSIRFVIAGGCAMFSIAIAGSLNQTHSHLVNCSEYTLVKKGIDNVGWGKSYHYLKVAMDEKTRSVLCSITFWDKTHTGHAINICTYKGILSFDYLVLRDDKWQRSPGVPVNGR